MPVEFELRQLGDGRHLAQETQRVEAALLQRACRPGQLHGPAELALDLLDELADLRRRGLGLLALDADQRGLVLLVGEPDLEHAVGEQGDADNGDEQADIFAKQSAANLSVARKSGLDRRSTPSATTRSSDGIDWPTYAISALSRAYAYHQARGDRSVASKRSTASFEHLVGAAEEWQWNGEAECLRGPEIDDKLDFGDVLNRQLCRLLAFQIRPV